MKFFCCLIIICTTCKISNCQNLVRNSSFEDYTSCPTGPSQISYSTGWSSSQYSPDYFNSCADTGSSPVFGVPFNSLGYQVAANGDAYAGIFCYGLCGITYTANIREWLTGPLTQPLYAGVKYFVSFKVVRGDLSSFAVNKIGARFLFAPGSYSIQNNPQVYSNKVIKDTQNWTVLYGSFIADSNYSYISIGNHFDDSHIDIVQTHLLANCSYNAYYFIDEVCVSSDSLTCFSEVVFDEPEKHDELMIFPNPFSEQINITTNSNELYNVKIFDVASRIIIDQSFTNSISINTELFAQGIYLYELRNEIGVLKNSKIIKY